MDEILASIRRILSEDGTAAAGAGPGAEQPRPGELLLDDSMRIAPGAVEAAAALEAAAPQAAAPVGAPAAAPAAPLAAARAVADSDRKERLMEPTPEPLITGETANRAASAISDLARAVSQDRAAAVSGRGPTIEDMVREELRPLLQAWLEAHLPPLVERLVRAEIARVVDRSGV